MSDKIEWNEEELNWNYLWEKFYESPKYKEWEERVPKLEAEIERLKSLLAQTGV